MEIKIPQLGATMTESVFVRWLVADGALVRADEPFYELATSKVTVELSSPTAGTLQILKPDSSYPVGTVIGKLHSHFRRTESTRPVAPSVNVTDETMLESPSGPLMAHRVISLRCGIWSLPGHSGHRSSPHQSGSICEYAL